MRTVYCIRTLRVGTGCPWLQPGSAGLALARRVRNPDLFTSDGIASSHHAEYPTVADLALRLASTLSIALLAPVLVRQGRRVRRTTPRLPEAAGPRTGEIAGRGAPVRLLVLGESTAAGVGAADHREGLAGQAAGSLASAGGRAVRWRVIARNGATAASTLDALFAPAADADVVADVVVVALGVNDTLRLHGSARWTRDLRRLVEAVRGRCGPVPVILAGVPPMGRFPGLPQPLRGVLGLRARLLDRAAARMAAAMEGVHHVSVPLPAAEVDAFFCGDRIHPSPRGYAQIGAVLGRAAAAVLGS
jgi:lysophospholipase L1-like esterase